MAVATGAAGDAEIVVDVALAALENEHGLGIEAVAHSQRGARVDLRAIPSAEPGMSPLELWCNEAQERYVIVVAPEALETFAAIAARERCPFAVIGTIDDTGQLTVTDPLLGGEPVDMALEVLLGKPPRMVRDVRSAAIQPRPLDLNRIEMEKYRPEMRKFYLNKAVRFQ